MKISAGRSRAKRAGKARFHIVPFINPSGETAFRVTGYKPNGQRVRENFKTEEEAVGRKSELDIEAANIVTTTATRLKATRLTDEQVKDAERAFAKLGNHSFLAAVEYFLADYREPVRQMTVADAVEQFIADRAKQNRRPDTLRSLRGRLGMFARLHGQKHVADVTGDICRDFVFRPGTASCNQKNDRLALSNFLNWCVRRQFTVSNPITLVDKPAVDAHEPSVLSLADCRQLLAAARAYKDGLLLPFVAISLFAAVRPKELARLSWDDVDLTQNLITIQGKNAKMRERRNIEISDNLVAWLKSFALARQPFVGQNWRRDFDAVKTTAGYGGRSGQGQAAQEAKPWVPDIMRHTAISMHLAMHQHEGKTASWAGNSPDIIQRHYRGLVTPADAKAFWTITPENGAADTIPLRMRACA